MTEPMKEVKRRAGYYLYKQYQFPAVSTVMRSSGNSEGLIHWACKQGGMGVIWGLSQLKDSVSLKEKLGSPSCIEWAVEQAKMGLASEGDRVKNFGSRVHGGIEAKLKRMSLDQSFWTEEEKTALKTFEDFYLEVGFDPYSIETVVYSPEYKFAGQLDLVADVSSDQADLIRPYLTRSCEDIEPGLLICDFKTGTLYPRLQVVQLAAYAQAYRETYKRECTGGLLINILREEPTKIKCHYFTLNELNDAFENGFKPAYRVWSFFDAPRWFSKQFQVEVETPQTILPQTKTLSTEVSPQERSAA